MPEKTPTEQIAEILGVEFLPLLDPSDVRELQKALPGYQGQLPTMRPASP
ncbi:MAG: hypothetical protein ACTFAK_10405 [Candidatus Electronema sp. VV]